MQNTMNTIWATFGTVDEAERAISRLRRAVPELGAEVTGSRIGAAPADAPWTASVYYPWRVNMGSGELHSMPQELGSRVIFTSDLLGLPIYHDNETELRITIPAKEAERTRALLVNAGGYRIRML